MPRTDPFRFPVNVRYLEADQQGVVFNMWYLAYFDDAMTAFLEAGGLRYSSMLEAGFDVQLVHTELDWTGSLRWGEPAWVDVAVEQLGNTSFTLQFTVRGGREESEPVATGATVYVVVATDGSGKRPIPPPLLEVLKPAV